MIKTSKIAYLGIALVLFCAVSTAFAIPPFETPLTGGHPFDTPPVDTPPFDLPPNMGHPFETPPVDKPPMGPPLGSPAYEHAPPFSASGVPEPSTLALAVLALLGVCSRRRTWA